MVVSNAVATAPRAYTGVHITTVRITEIPSQLPAVQSVLSRARRAGGARPTATRNVQRKCTMPLRTAQSTAWVRSRASSFA